MKYKNLNKENFFNKMNEKYPVAMKKFCLWIDEYKKKNDWEILFGNRFKAKHEQVKYHDLPLEMQITIWMVFNIETMYKERLPPDMVEYSMTNIEMELIDIENKFKNLN